LPPRGPNSGEGGPGGPLASTPSESLPRQPRSGGAPSCQRSSLERLIKAKLIGVLDAAHAQEHSLEVHLPSLQVALDEFALVPIVAGDASPQAVVALLDAVWAGPETLIVVSTDLSHYLDYRSCQATDQQPAHRNPAASALRPETTRVEALDRGGGLEQARKGRELSGAGNHKLPRWR